MARKIIVFLFLVLVIVHLKDGTNIYFDDATRGLVRFPGRSGVGKVWLTIETGRDFESRTIAGFNWDVVSWYENLKEGEKEKNLSP